MMKALSLLMAICCTCLIFPTGITFAQGEPIKVKFEVDRKETSEPFKIFLSVGGGAVFEPPISDNSLVLPPELRSVAWIQLRFMSGNYDLYYEDVHISKFSDEMIFGVDNAPFDEGRLNGNPDRNREVILIYYLGTGRVCQTVFVYQ